MKRAILNSDWFEDNRAFLDLIQRGFATDIKTNCEFVYAIFVL